MSYDAQPVGFLADVTDRAREAANEPLANAKWTDTKVWPKIVEAWGRIMDEINANSDSRIIARYSVTIPANEQSVMMPPNMGRFLKLGMLQENLGTVVEAVYPRAHLNPMGAGITFDGPYMFFDPVWNDVDTPAVIEYIPNGWCTLHLGTFDSSTATSTTFALDTDPSEGYFDSTPNAYLGCVVNLLGTEEDISPAQYNVFPKQTRVISGYDPQTNIVTVTPALDFDPSAEGLGNVIYEVVPFGTDQFRDAIVWHVASQIAAVNKDPQSYSMASSEYARAMRSIRMRFSNLNGRTGNRFIGDVPGTGRFGWRWGEY